MPSTCCANSQGNIIPLAFLDTSTGAIETEPSHRSHLTVEGQRSNIVTTHGEESSSRGRYWGARAWKDLGGNASSASASD